MKTEKQQVQELIDQMPDSVSTETIISELAFRLTILRRSADAELGRNLISHEEVEREFSEWLDSTGT